MHHLEAQLLGDGDAAIVVIAGGEAEIAGMAAGDLGQQRVIAGDLMADFLVAHPLHVIVMVERVILQLDEIMGGQLLQRVLIVAGEAAGDEDGEGDFLGQQIIGDPVIEKGRRLAFAGVEGQRDDLLAWWEDA